MAWTVARRSTALVTLVCLSLTGLVLADTPAAHAAPVLPGAETAMIRHINRARAANGLAPLRRNLQLVRHARHWSAAMARRGVLAHRRNLADVVYGPYRRLGENVGMARIRGASARQLVAALHRGFMASPGHRMHVLGRYNLVGVGVFRAGDGALWVTVNFALGRNSRLPLYRDFSTRRVRRSVGRLFLRGAAPGCGAGRYCPRSTATRRQMATMVDRATRTRNASRYVTYSCGSLATCRTWSVTKVDLAVAIARALSLAPVAGQRFTDVNEHQAGAVNAVVRAGIMSGCSTTRFCGGALVSRGRLAVIANRVRR